MGEDSMGGHASLPLTIETDSPAFELSRTELPASCNSDETPPPRATIEAFVALYYPFFEERTIDWATERETLLSKATDIA